MVVFASAVVGEASQILTLGDPCLPFEIGGYWRLLKEVEFLVRMRRRETIGELAAGSSSNFENSEIQTGHAQKIFSFSNSVKYCVRRIKYFSNTIFHYFLPINAFGIMYAPPSCSNNPSRIIPSKTFAKYSRKNGTRCHSTFTLMWLVVVVAYHVRNPEADKLNARCARVCIRGIQTLAASASV